MAGLVSRDPHLIHQCTIGRPKSAAHARVEKMMEVVGKDASAAKLAMVGRVMHRAIRLIIGSERHAIQERVTGEPIEPAFDSAKFNVNAECDRVRSTNSSTNECMVRWADLKLVRRSKPNNRENHNVREDQSDAC